jgi:hypothetical protein
MSCSPETIFSLQVEQRLHDEAYHPDIARLDLSRRISHLILHLSKYCGDSLLAAVRADENASLKALVDTAIISLSAATALQVDLSLHEERPDPEVAGLTFTTFFAISVGRLAKAAEALDHVEDYPIRRVWNEEFFKIFHRAVLELDTLAGRPSSAAELIRARLSQVRLKNKF